MMDSQEKAPEQGNAEELKTVVNSTPEAENKPEAKNMSEAENKPEAENISEVENKSEAENESEETKKVYASKQEVLNRVKEIAQSDELPNRDEMDHLKASFYRFHIAERDQKQKEYLEAGGDPEKYQMMPDDDEETFKANMQVIKEKRAKAFERAMQEREDNLKRREEIIEKIKTMATSPDEANKSYNDFKALQQEWKEIGPVPPEKSSETWRNYQLYVEQFYDLLNLNREAREYDFKKNLEAKTRLCEEAEKLAEEPDVIRAFHQLQDLHEQYREIGPVSKDLREEIWTRFKNASTVINKRHQEHFEKLRANEEENLAKKTALCEKTENIAQQENKNSTDWEKHSKEIIGIQQEWKTIGFAPKKSNEEIFQRFRKACDDFFSRKAAYFKEVRARLYENAEKKKALVAKAQELADSTDWKATSDKLIQLQKEWRAIGTAPRKVSDQLWNDFLSACNHFFDARNAAHAGTHNEEKENLQKKHAIIEELKKIAADADVNAREKVQELADKYNAIGHVPYRDKDKVYKEYHDVMDRIFTELHISAAKRHLDNFKNNLRGIAKKGEDAIDNERARLMYRYEQLKQEITTYENNLGFLNISSKKGNSLVDEMNRKVQKLKDDAQMIREKIKAIDQTK